MRKLLDTTFLIDFLTRGEEVRPYLEANDGPETEFLTTSISMKELAAGLHRVGDEPSISELRSDLGWTEVLPFSTRHAFYAGRIEDQLNRRDIRGDRLNSLAGDVFVGGVALAEDAAVVTRNVEDFAPLHEVDVETY